MSLGVDSDRRSVLGVVGFGSLLGLLAAPVAAGRSVLELELGLGPELGFGSPLEVQVQVQVDGRCGGVERCRMRGGEVEVGMRVAVGSDMLCLSYCKRKLM